MALRAAQCRAFSVQACRCLRAKKAFVIVAPAAWLCLALAPGPISVRYPSSPANQRVKDFPPARGGMRLACILAVPGWVNSLFGPWTP